MSTSNTMSIGELKNYLDSNLAPRAWQRIKLRLLPQFNAKGIFLHQMKDELELDIELLNLISNTLESIYKEKLPESFSIN